MTSSYLISSISSALNNLDLRGKGHVWDVFLLKIELRNLQLQLVFCFRKFGNDLPAHLSGVEGAIGRVLLREIPDCRGSSDSCDPFWEWMYMDALPELRGLVEQVTDECYTVPLTVDDVVAIVNIILDNFDDFVVFAGLFLEAGVSRLVNRDAFAAFVAQVSFLKGLLVFAERAGVELQGLLIHIQPVAVNAALVFVRDQPRDKWCEEVLLKCSAVIGIATAPQVYEAYTQALSAATFSSTPAGILENFLNSLIAFLWDVLLRHLNSRVKDQLKVLYERLRLCRRILKQMSGGFDWETRDQIGALICGAGMLVCSLHHTYIEISYLDRFSELLEKLGALLAQYASESTAPTTYELSLSDSAAYALEDMTISDGDEESVHQPQRSSSGPLVADFQDDEVNSVLDRLMRGSKQLQIVPICGMPGLGKTTFASTLYNHRSIIYHFQSRAWCPISQVLDKKGVMLQLLNQLTHKSGNYSEMTEDDIANQLRQSLKGKRYLVVLDDVWATEAWHSLAASFPDDSTQSRIILTSRHRDIVPHVLPYQQPHLLRLREDTECFEILQKKLSYKKGLTSDFGMAIAKMCKGLPLTAVIVAGFLETTKPQGWKRIFDHLSSSGVSDENQCNIALDLSFKHLPNDLKLCFLYFAAFREDEEISVKRLLQLWIAEGFVRESESKRIEDVAGEYMENLIQRSLVMVARNRSIGGVKTCRIHDLMHDFCLRKAKQENFFHVLSERDDEFSDFVEPPNLQRLSIHSDPHHFEEARLFCPRAHSLLLFSIGNANMFDMLFIVQMFKLLTVLDMHNYIISGGIPREIELLHWLRYLSIQCDLFAIPSSLGNLPNLETLIGEFWTRNVLPFPHTLWNLHKLKWLYIRRSSFRQGFSLPTENLENFSALLGMETLCGVVFNSYSRMEQQMRKIPNIRRLKCNILPGGESTAHSKKIVIPDFLNQLRCLTISGEGRLQCEFAPNENLRRLSLSGFELMREEIADIGKLPNLEVLKLQGICFQGDTLDMEEGEFSKLRYLKLVDMDLKRWTVSDEQLPCLNKLILHNCNELEELPFDCLSYSATLEEIEVRTCSPNVEGFARQIQGAQEDFGNLVKVHIETRE